MKIIDCFMYFDEDMILDIRLNTLNEYVSKFIICEARYNHNGLKKKLNFDINKFEKFRNKITYIVLENQPPDLEKIENHDNLEKKNSKILDNALKRENFQRNFCFSELQKYSPEDLIIINDLDEIPNLKNFRYKKKITIFKQKMFYYKLNLEYPNFNWSGSKICKLKYLKNPQWLRNIKSKKYPFWRIDTFFDNKKYLNLEFIESGGWHFTNIKSPEAIDFKMRSFLHHLEYEKSGFNSNKLKQLILEKKVLYNHNADKKNSDKWKDGKFLNKIDTKLLPEYIVANISKFNKWLD